MRFKYIYKMDEKPDSSPFEKLLEHYLPGKKDLRESDPPPTRTDTGRQLTLDLHGLSLQEAEKQLCRILNEAASGGIASIRLVTGKGIHSPGGKSILREKIRNGLNNGQYGRVRSFRQGKAQEGGSGVFILTL